MMSFFKIFATSKKWFAYAASVLLILIQPMISVGESPFIEQKYFDMLLYSLYGMIVVQLIVDLKVKKNGSET